MSIRSIRPGSMFSTLIPIGPDDILHMRRAGALHHSARGPHPRPLSI